MYLLRLVVFVVLSLHTLPVCAGIVGNVKHVEGQAWIVRDQGRLSVAAGVQLMAGDRLETGKDGALGVILEDDTIISLGPDSELLIDTFIYQPETSEFGMFTRLLRGTFTYLSGMIGKLAPDKVKIETPAGMVAVRGTHFLVKIDV